MNFIWDFQQILSLGQHQLKTNTTILWTAWSVFFTRFLVSMAQLTVSVWRENGAMWGPGWLGQGQGQWYVVTIRPTFVSWSQSSTSPISNNILSKTDSDPNLITVLASSWRPIWGFPAWQDHLYVSDAQQNPWGEEYDDRRHSEKHYRSSSKSPICAQLIDGLAPSSVH